MASAAFSVSERCRSMPPMLRESRCDKWSAGVPVNEGKDGEEGGVVYGSLLILLG